METLANTREHIRPFDGIRDARESSFDVKAYCWFALLRRRRAVQGGVQHRSEHQQLGDSVPTLCQGGQYL